MTRIVLKFEIQIVNISRRSVCFAYAEMGACGGAAPASPHFRHSAQRCAFEKNLIFLDIINKDFIYATS